MMRNAVLLAAAVVGLGAFITLGWWLSGAVARNPDVVGFVLFYCGLQTILLFPVAVAVLVRRIVRASRPAAPDQRADYCEPRPPA